MKIKRLEITGFKSFKDKTVIHFDSNITAVVGPNGCGKSNIVDALQWVMGEMSAKDLRGSSMEDVIFQGAKGYVPGGLAEVSLTLANDGGSFPTKYLQYSEIQITRRLHRSGESEYLIQQEPARLKDIQEIFMDTGAGSKGFSLIEQGAIGKLVTAKPDEMRILLEEAAGITKFKARKKESQRRMHSTDQNLVRLNDIINELKKQLDSLERQSRKANRYKALQKDIEIRDLLIASKEFLDFQTQQLSHQASLEKLKDQDFELIGKMTECEKQKEAAKLMLLEDEKRIETHQLAVEDVQKNIRQKEDIIQNLEFEITQSQRQDAHHLDLKSEMDIKKEDLQKDLQELQTNYQTLQQKAHQMEGQQKSLHQEYEKHQILLQEDSESLDQKQKELMSVSQAKTQLEVQITALKERQKEQGLQETIIQTRLKDFTDKQKLYTGRKQGVQRKLESQRQIQLNLAGDLKSFKENKDRMLKELTLQKEKSDRTKDQLSQTINQLKALTDLHKNFEGFQKGAKEVLIWQQETTKAKTDMESSTPHTLRFLPIADVIDVPKEYERALEAVLGHRLQTLLVSSSKDIFEALDFLKTKGAGRAGFFNTSDKTPITLEHPKELHLLKDVISIDESYRHCIDRLLDKVAIVDVINSDLSMSYSGWTFVTLEGDVLEPEGILMGGTPESLDLGVLKLRRNIKELSRQKQELSKQLGIAQTHFQKAQKRLAALEQNFQQTQDHQMQQEIKLVELKKDLERVSKEFEDNEEMREYQSKELQRLLEQKDLQDKQLTSLQKDFADIFSQRESLLCEIKDLNEKRNVCQKQVQSLRENVQQLEVKSTACIQEAEGKKHQIEMIKEQINDLSNRIEQIIAEKKQNKQTSLENQNKQKQEQLALQSLLGEQKKFQDQISTVKNKYEMARKKLEDIDEQLLVFRKEQGQVQAEKNELSLITNTLDLKTKALLENIQERYMVELKDVAMGYESGKKDLPEGYPKWDEIDWDKVKEDLDLMQTRLKKMGDVHLGAIKEHDEVHQRYLFLSRQRDDLVSAKEQLHQVIDKINRICNQRFKQTFEVVNERFQKVFPTLFGGGEAFLSLTELKDKEDVGITVTARPPGKRLQNVSLLSGGEKALTAVSLIFAIFLVKPSPYCLLDEVDAPLDDANVFRFNDLVKEMSKHSQMILVTHNKYTMEISEKLYGVTMEEKGISKMVSVDMIS